MAKLLNNHSSISNQLQRSSNMNPQSTILASCYSVNTTTPVVDGFHYCTTLGAGNGIPEVPSGSKTPIQSPPPEPCLNPETGRGFPVANSPEHRGEAAQTIPEECERLFCDKLSAIFLGEGRISRQESLGVGAHPTSSNDYSGREHRQIQTWFEVLDYTSDCVYRGFVTDMNDDERTLFVFFGHDELGQGLKTGLIALFELANISSFACSQIVACVPRSQDATELAVIRNLGWCGFALSTLQPWCDEHISEPCLSTRWLFLSAEV
ncbi:ornithine decarboxylase antizyme [Aspergillus steynii IBT 23096]|uniref:Ornithine decarboxylase antizyme n=1 Tax=Aspergillus steynii IBT 23096 TaxID=1392250 RepID=A0A2I2GC92_9EURO|nr:ornithine decarboxylase antizyme [Aspergillus steynii IBT 23096]PLB50499.1 ornithine decarboxylase antizyme [Aspergillus steynii IBT 23096]